MVIRVSRRTLVFLAAGVSVAFAGAPAPAQQYNYPIVIEGVPQPNLRVERVAYWDLNLASQAGERILNRRVSRAVERVCDYDSVRWYGLSEPDYNYCKSGAWQRARPQITGAVYRARQAAYYRY